MGVKGDVAQNIQQAVDAGLSVEKLIDDHYTPLFNNAISALEVAFFVADGVVELFEELFEFF